MAVETFGHIDSLNTANPTSSDPKSEGDDHLRGIKTALKNSFPNVTGAVTATQVELNALTDKASGTSSGIDVSGTVTADEVKLGDSEKITFGASDDLQIYHIPAGGGHSYIKETGTGNLRIQGSDITLQDPDGHGFISCNDTGTGGTIYLKHGGATKLTTKSTGIEVSGTVTCDGLNLGDNNVLNVGSIACDSIKGDGDDNTSISFAGSDVTRFYQGGSARLEVSNTGIDVTGTVASSALTLDAINASITGDAQDIFIYDTSKDSDGGAWRKRTQHTSWYNEPDLPAGTGAGQFNSLTRSTRKEFPAVAVIVSEASKVTIYDGDDPDLDMWRINADYLRPGGGSITSSTMVNGTLIIGTTVGYLGYSFIDDVRSNMNSGQHAYRGEIATDHTDTTTKDSLGTSYIVNNVVNDIAMTVLPNAPVDSVTLLPIPTIAVATNGGVSVIKDDGTVVDITISQTNKGIGKIDFTEENQLWFTAQQSGSDPDYWRVILAPIPNSDISASHWQSFASTELSEYAYADYGSLPALASQTYNQGITYATAPLTVGGNKGFSKLIHNSSDPTNSSVAYIASKYNTGYMTGDIRGAWNVDTDVTALSGTELVTGWVNGSTYAYDTLSTSGATITSAITDGSDYAGACSNGISMTAGLHYTLSLPLTINSGGVVSYVLFATDQTGAGSLGTGSYITNIGTGNHSITFTPPSTGTYHLLIQSTNGVTSNFTTGAVSVREAIPDRSVKGNGLAVHGTLDVDAVASGAELKAISGFSSSNYLEQPYSSDLDFGTGDFSVMGWVKAASSSLTETIVGRYAADGTDPEWALRKSGLNLLSFSTNGGTDVVSTSMATGTWVFVSAVRRSGSISLYVNGAFGNSAAFSASLTNSSAILGVGVLPLTSHANPLANGSLALVRISATAPSAEQIKEIYEAEKPLFQANAKCTLNGTSDAVNALAYDDSTELLHVGTTSSTGGRSTFQGLRRVAETSTSTTEIAAQGGLIVEET